jgi:aspartate carbamoyltransferase catalytic subunit
MTSLSTRTRTLFRRARAYLRARCAAVRSSASAGMTTAEYAVGTLAACAFAVVLIAVVRSGPVKAALAKVITSALGLRA